MARFFAALVTTASGLAVATIDAQPTLAPDVLKVVDHLVYAAPDLSAAIARLDRLLGVRATPGGQHPGRGTRNALISVGQLSYIEIIGPDPDQPKPDAPRQFGIDSLSESRLVTWAAKQGAPGKLEKLEKIVGTAAAQGVRLGEVMPGSRQRPDGV